MSSLRSRIALGRHITRAMRVHGGSSVVCKQLSASVLNVDRVHAGDCVNRCVDLCFAFCFGSSRYMLYKFIIILIYSCRYDCVITERERRREATAVHQHRKIIAHPRSVVPW